MPTVADEVLAGRVASAEAVLATVSAGRVASAEAVLATVSAARQLVAAIPAALALTPEVREQLQGLVADIQVAVRHLTAGPPDHLDGGGSEPRAGG